MSDRPRKVHPSGLVFPKKEIVPRTFSYKRYRKRYGVIPVLPPNVDFIVTPPLEIKDQGFSDACTAFSTSSICEPVKKVLIEPAYLFYKGKQILGGDWRAFGCTPEAILRAAVKFGMLSEKASPFSFEVDGRDKVADPATWDASHDALAAMLRMGSYLSVDFYKSRFDSARALLWDRYRYNQTHADQKGGMVSGALWADEWMYPAGGIVPKTYTKGTVGHQFAIIGQKMIFGEPYLVIENSYGVSPGDNGYQYFPREVVDREFKYLFAVNDADPEELKKTTWTLLQSLKDALISLLDALKKKLNGWTPNR